MMHERLQSPGPPTRSWRMRSLRGSSQGGREDVASAIRKGVGTEAWGGPMNAEHLTGRKKSGAGMSSHVTFVVCRKTHVSDQDAQVLHEHAAAAGGKTCILEREAVHVQTAGERTLRPHLLASSPPHARCCDASGVRKVIEECSGSLGPTAPSRHTVTCFDDNGVPSTHFHTSQFLLLYQAAQ